MLRFVTQVRVVIPALNEAHHLPGLLEDLGQVALPLDVTVVDGGSHDDTVLLARAGGARVVTTHAGRAIPMHGGAREWGTAGVCFIPGGTRVTPPGAGGFGRAVGVHRDEGGGVRAKTLEANKLMTQFDSLPQF